MFTFDQPALSCSIQMLGVSWYDFMDIGRLLSFLFCLWVLLGSTRDTRTASGWIRRPAFKRRRWHISIIGVALMFITVIVFYNYCARHEASKLKR